MEDEPQYLSMKELTQITHALNVMQEVAAALKDVSASGELVLHDVNGESLGSLAYSHAFQSFVYRPPRS